MNNLWLSLEISKTSALYSHVLSMAEYHDNMKIFHTQKMDLEGNFTQYKHCQLHGISTWKITWISFLLKINYFEPQCVASLLDTNVHVTLLTFHVIRHTYNSLPFLWWTMVLRLSSFPYSENAFLVHIRVTISHNVILLQRVLSGMVSWCSVV